MFAPRIIWSLRISIAIEFKRLSKSFVGQNVLRDVSFQLESGKVYSFIGESGCGKTTCLKLMNGLLKPTMGEVLIGGTSFDYIRGVQLRRQMGYSPQGSGLFPHMSVLENLCIVARKSGWSRDRCEARTHELLEIMNLKPDILSKKPYKISGGQQQRVGMARALFMKPDLLLMDEPFGALDPITREELQDWFLEVRKGLNITAVLVTHDLGEAFKLSHEVLVLHGGRVEQKATPHELLTFPATDYVKEFIQSHSPGQVLGQIKIYSIYDPRVVRSVKSEFGYQMVFSNGESQSYSSERDFKENHENLNQDFIVWTDEEGKFLELEGGGSPLNVKDSLMVAIKKLFGHKALPVVNSGEKVLGYLSWERIYALSRG